MMTIRVQQWTAKQDRDDLRLIPPLAEEFALYGGPDTVERAREWALERRYLLAEGIPACAHGLYLMAGCPGLSSCRNNFRQFDHVQIWVPASQFFSERPFILAHPYDSRVSAATESYALAHGLRLGISPEFGDGWYGSGTIPIRMTIPAEYPVWPIEAKAAVLLGTQPVAWPEGEEQ